MAFTSLGACNSGILLPNYYHTQHRFETSIDGFIDRDNLTQIDAVGEAVYIHGHLLWADGAAHTVSTSGKFVFRPGGVTWATSGSKIKCGFQGVSTVAGNPARPDGVWGTYKELVQGTDTITNAAWNEYTFGSGSNSMAHGQHVIFVIEMTAKSGADYLQLNGAKISTGDGGPPSCTVFNSGSTYTPQSAYPYFAIKADDGTVGLITGTIPIFSSSQYSAYNSASTPDEYALYFKVPVPVKVSGLWGYFNMSNAAGTYDLSLYSSPTSSPAVMDSGNAKISGYGRWNTYIGSTGWRQVVHYFGSEVELVPGTAYCVGLKATHGSYQVNLQYVQLANSDAAYRNYFFGGTDLAAYSRSDTGNFSAVATVSTYELPCLGIVVSSFRNATGGGEFSAVI